MRKETKCVHSGKMVDEITGGVNTPIFTSSSFEFLDRDNLAYPRYFNTPNQNSVVAKLAALENAADGVLFSSGMAAMSTAILAFAKPGDHVVMLDALYGGTHSLATSLFAEWGIECSFTETNVAANGGTYEVLCTLTFSSQPALEFFMGLDDEAGHEACRDISTNADKCYRNCA